MDFKVDKKPYDDRELFVKDTIELNPNQITCLVGCNGSGKTTLIDYLKRNLNKLEAIDVCAGYPRKGFKGDELDFTKKEYYYADFSKKTDDAKDGTDWLMGKFTVAFSSTGEGIVYRLGKILETLGRVIADPELKGKNLFIFFDDCDAGTSLDKIVEIKDVMNLIAGDCKRRGINYFIVLTANSFEMCRDVDCISVHNFEHLKFTDYDEYKKFVLESSKIKEKSYEE